MKPSDTLLSLPPMVDKLKEQDSHSVKTWLRPFFKCFLYPILCWKMDLVHRGKEEGMNIPQQLLSNPGSVEKEKNIDLVCNRFGF